MPKDQSQPRIAEESFIEGSFTNGNGSRDYKLFIPSGYHGQSTPLVVMLHGCTQNPDDFAAGTRMNELAEENTCFVVYPSQSVSANHYRCWNWFSARDQERGHGEPSIIAGITGDVIKAYHIDARRVFIAGMSAGGAMAVIMAATYPEIYAAVGVHSGMPYKAARNVFSALTAMTNGAADSTSSDLEGSARIIVFHGDEDNTVHPSNGDQIVSQLIGAGDAPPMTDSSSMQASEGNGRAYDRTVYRDEHGEAIAEHWVVHGTGHFWSGGSLSGSYTDPRGPDASREMLRFFLGKSDKSAKVPHVDEVRNSPPHLVHRFLEALGIHVTGAPENPRPDAD